jgi:hypothetical protein
MDMSQVEQIEHAGRGTADSLARTRLHVLRSVGGN